MSLGMYAGLRHEFESRIASEGTRLPTCYVPSSNLAINNVNGTEDTIDSCDFLNGISNLFEFSDLFKKL